MKPKSPKSTNRNKGRVTFLPSQEARHGLDRELSARRGVPVTFIINEALTAFFSRKGAA